MSFYSGYKFNTIQTLSKWFLIELSKYWSLREMNPYNEARMGLMFILLSLKDAVIFTIKTMFILAHKHIPAK